MTTVSCQTECQQQEMIDYLASNLQLRYRVVDNWLDTPPAHLRAEVNLTNVGDTTVDDTSWEMYFSHARLLQLLRVRERAQLGDTGLWVQHVNGYLHTIYPGVGFSGFLPGETVHVEFIAEAGEVARSDIFPNWYITGRLILLLFFFFLVFFLFLFLCLLFLFLLLLAPTFLLGLLFSLLSSATFLPSLVL